VRAPNVGLLQHTSDLPNSAGLESLKHAASHRDPAAAKAAATQFESLFAEQLIKTMRQTSMGDAMFPGASQNYRELYDREMAKRLTQGKGLGLQPMIRKALGGGSATAVTGASAHAAMSLAKYRTTSAAIPLRAAIETPSAEATAAAGSTAMPQASLLPQLRSVAPAEPAIAVAAPTSPAVTQSAAASPRPSQTAAVSAAGNSSPRAARALLHPSSSGHVVFSSGSGRTPPPHAVATPPLATSRSAPNRLFSAEDFVTAAWPHAQRAAAALGVSPQVLIAQAALETGWGKYVGGDNNLFGIKAGAHWQGATRTLTTTEYTGTTPHRESATFRSYSSVADSFDDFAHLLKTNPRYAAALGTGNDHARFARALQQAGYATDPGYAAKITSIANGPAFANVLQISASAPLLASR